MSIEWYYVNGNIMCSTNCLCCVTPLYKYIWAHIDKSCTNKAGFVTNKRCTKS